MRKEDNDIMIDTVIFDLDGTLLNTLEDLTDSVNAVMEQYGFPMHTMEEIRSRVGNGAAKLIERVLPRGLEEPAYEDILAAFREHYRIHCEDKTMPYEGVVQMLAAVKQAGYRMAVVSNKPDRAVKQLCAKFFGEYVQKAFGDSEGIKRKPAPDLVYRALAELSSEASCAVYVGDSEVDLQTAAGVPMTCISVTWGFRTPEQLLAAGACGDRMIRTGQELLPLLDLLRREG